MAEALAHVLGARRRAILPVPGSFLVILGRGGEPWGRRPQRVVA